MSEIARVKIDRGCPTDLIQGLGGRLINGRMLGVAAKGRHAVGLGWRVSNGAGAFCPNENRQWQKTDQRNNKESPKSYLHIIKGPDPPGGGNLSLVQSSYN